MENRFNRWKECYSRGWPRAEDPAKFGGAQKNEADYTVSDELKLWLGAFWPALKRPSILPSM